MRDEGGDPGRSQALHCLRKVVSTNCEGERRALSHHVGEARPRPEIVGDPRDRGGDPGGGQVAKGGEVAMLHALAGTDDGHRITEGFDLGEHVARQQHGASTLALGAHRSLEYRFHERVETTGGLVEEEKLDVRSEGSNQCHLLAVTLGIPPGSARGIEFELLDQGISTSRVDAPAEPTEQVDDLASRQLWPETDLAGHISQSKVEFRGVTPRVAAEEFDMATVGPQQSERHSKGSGLARTIGAEEAVDLPFRHIEVEGSR